MFCIAVHFISYQPFMFLFTACTPVFQFSIRSLCQFFHVTSLVYDFISGT